MTDKHPCPEPMTTDELARWFPPKDKDNLEVWEDIAAWFNKETHHLRPGKDKPPGWHMEKSDGTDCCADAWIEWCADKRQAAILGLQHEIAALKKELEEARREPLFSQRVLVPQLMKERDAAQARVKELEDAVRALVEACKDGRDPNDPYLMDAYYRALARQAQRKGSGIEGGER